MKLSTKGRYGWRALVDLAVHSEEGTGSIQSIANRQEISVSYLEQLMGKLRKAGLIISVRGALGGYRLARSASEISVGDVLRALEGTLEAVDCPGYGAEASCKAAPKCVTKLVWQRINDSISQAVDTVMIDQLVQESKRVNGQEIKGKGQE